MYLEVIRHCMAVGELQGKQLAIAPIHYYV